MTRSRAAATAAILLFVAGCGSSGGGESVAPVDDTQAITSTTDAADTGDDASEATPPPDDDSTAPSPFPLIVTRATEAGPRPTLGWEPVEGASEYRVVVLDADRAPYWAWTGAGTSVPLGGLDDPSAVGAWTFESLTWTVAAIDQNGDILALSVPAELTP